MARKIRVSVKREELVESMKGLSLLGECVAWDLKTQGQTHTSVINALRASGLDEKLARIRLPKQAWNRAVKKLQEERVIDEVEELGDEINFQFTLKELEHSEMKFRKEANLTLNKVTGIVKCVSHPELELKAQTELDRCIALRTTNDITLIIKKIFEKQTDLIPMTSQGGFYFVPISSQNLLAPISDFLNRLDGRLVRLPIPMGTQQGDASIQASVKDFMSDLINKHNEAVEKFHIGTRDNTIKLMAEELNTTRVRIEAYSVYLQDKSEELLHSLEEAKEKLRLKVEALEVEKNKEEEIPETVVKEENGKFYLD